eukprot:jgi/Astpho2/3423/Aster-x0163
MFCAEKGNLQLVVTIYEAAEESRGTMSTRADLLNHPLTNGQTLLMRACYNGYVDITTYLLSKGADATLGSQKGDTALHMAARNGHAACITRLLTSRVLSPEGQPTRLGDLVLTDGVDSQKFADCSNGAGMTALHVAAMKGSPQAVTALVQHGASVSAQIMGSSQTPWLSRGSTALHIAAARGSHTVAQALLEAQGQDPGVDLRRVRNHRGQKASQLARLSGHAELAAELGRSRRRQGRPQRAAAEGLEAAGAPKRSAEAVLTVLIQRAKLLLSLRAMTVQSSQGMPIEILAQSDTHTDERQVQEAAAGVLGCTEAWKRGNHSVKPAASLLRLIAALDELPVAQMLSKSWEKAELG